MVSIHRIVLDFSIVYVRYDEAFGERYKVIETIYVKVPSVSADGTFCVIRYGYRFSISSFAN